MSKGPMNTISMEPAARRRSGIPVRLAPRNICDVNPYICRMTPTEIKFHPNEQPTVSKMAFEPFPRSCKCCLNRNQPKPEVDCEPPVEEEEEEEPPKRKRRSIFGRRRPKKQQRKSYSKDAKKIEEEKQRVRLLREAKRRDEFVTACCDGLLLTPCNSAGTCSDDLEEKEQANFYIQCKYGPKQCTGARTKGVDRKKAGSEFPCPCRTCRYVEREQNPKTKCVDVDVEEKTVCYCGKQQTVQGPDPCADRMNKQTQSASRNGRNSATSIQPRHSAELCDVIPSGVAQLQCTTGGVECEPKLIFTAEYLQAMLIQQAQNGIELANTMNDKKQYRLVNLSAMPSPENGVASGKNQNGGKYVRNASTSTNEGRPEPTLTGTNKGYATTIMGQSNSIGGDDATPRSLQANKSGHICIPTAALPRESDASKFCIPLKFDDLNVDCPVDCNMRGKDGRLSNGRRTSYDDKRKRYKKCSLDNNEPKYDQGPLWQQPEGNNSSAQRLNNQDFDPLPKLPPQDGSLSNMREQCVQDPTRQGRVPRDRTKRHRRTSMCENKRLRSSPCEERGQARATGKMTLTDIDKKFEGYEKELLGAMEKVKKQRCRSENEGSSSASESAHEKCGRNCCRACL